VQSAEIISLMSDSDCREQMAIKVLRSHLSNSYAHSFTANFTPTELESAITVTAGQLECISCMFLFDNV